MVSLTQGRDIDDNFYLSLVLPGLKRYGSSNIFQFICIEKCNNRFHLSNCHYRLSLKNRKLLKKCARPSPKKTVGKLTLLIVRTLCYAFQGARHVKLMNFLTTALKKLDNSDNTVKFGWLNGHLDAVRGKKYRQ